MNFDLGPAQFGQFSSVAHLTNQLRANNVSPLDIGLAKDWQRVLALRPHHASVLNHPNGPT